MQRFSESEKTISLFVQNWYWIIVTGFYLFLYIPLTQGSEITHPSGTYHCKFLYIISFPDMTGFGVLSRIAYWSTGIMGAMALFQTFMVLGILVGVPILAYETTGPTYGWSFKCIKALSQSTQPKCLYLLVISSAALIFHLSFLSTCFLQVIGKTELLFSVFFCPVMIFEMWLPITVDLLAFLYKVFSFYFYFPVQVVTWKSWGKARCSVHTNKSISRSLTDREGTDIINLPILDQLETLVDGTTLF